MTIPRVWMITGTSSGFGRRLVDLALARGDQVIATSRTLSSISNLFQSNTSKSNLHRAELDVTAGTKQVKERVDAIVKAGGWDRIDVLVNNAGSGMPAFVEEGGTELLRRQFDLNVFGTMDVTTAVLPYMRQRKSGTVVMMGSRTAWRTEFKGAGFYGSSKAALHALSETMALELEPLGIRVLIVQPGGFRTEGIFRYDFHDSNKIADYDSTRDEAITTFMSPNGKQPGNPDKAMKALVEVVCGEGRARDREWPSYLMLGTDTDRDVRNKCKRIVRHLDEWRDIVTDVGFDES